MSSMLPDFSISQNQLHETPHKWTARFKVILKSRALAFCAYRSAGESAAEDNGLDD